MPSAERRASSGPGWGGWVMLGVALVTNLLIWAVDADLAEAGLHHFLYGLPRLALPLMVMFLLLWMFDLFVKPDRLARHLGRQAGPRAWVTAVAAGVVSLGPMYLWYPLLGRLREEGVGPALLASFLYSRAIKIPMLPFMTHYFGGPYTALFVLAILGGSLLSGFAMAVLERR
jgi:uncharacterized membrane protein YraQ (UPF0718 family)